MATEKRLIDANAVDYENIMCSQSQLHWLNAIIEKQPTVDAKEVVHAYWVPTVEPTWNAEFPDVIGWTCSECEHDGDVNFEFCPHCGAKMDREGSADGTV